MYCKNCGKEIADSSRYCSYCGATQEEHLAQKQEEKILTRLKKWWAELSNKQKTWLYVYGLWFLMHSLFWMVSDNDERDEFWPFYDGFDLECYDWTEFVIYVFVIPFAIILIKGLRKLIKEKK